MADKWTDRLSEYLDGDLPLSERVEVERHLEGILDHWKEGLTTAFLEGLNSLFSATKRKARGYQRSPVALAAV